MKVHEVKTETPYFSHVLDGRKKFEVVKNEIDFQVGDKIKLIEIRQACKKETGRAITKEIIYIFDLFNGFLILGLK